VRWGLKAAPWLGLLVALGILVPAAPAQACTTHHSFATFIFLPVSSNYADCSVADLDQRRTALDGVGGLPNNGEMYCVPTSSMDWMVWLSKFGYVFGLPPNTDWTKPSNFDEMSSYLMLMGALMGTTPTGGTGGSGFTAGLQAWLALNTEGRAVAPPLPFVENVYQRVANYSPDPNQMGVDAASGALVMVNVGFYNKDGKRTGGHEVAYQQGITNQTSTSITIHVMDPNNPPINDHVQSPYHADKWVLKPAGGGLWSVNDSMYNSTSTKYDGWTEIDPELVFSFDAPTITIDAPFRLVASTKHPRFARRLPLLGNAPVVDLAVAPLGFTEPFLRAGSNTIFAVNRLTGKTTRYALGPVGASHLTYGGPARTLFVAGTHQLVALAPNKQTIASLQLAQPIDALAYDNHDQRLVALIAAQDRVEFLSPSLQVLGSAPVPASLLAGEGAFSLAVGSDGALFIHRNGQPTVATAAPATQPNAITFSTVTLQDAPNALGLTVDDRGHLLVSSNGRLVELLANGQPAPNSFFTGMPAGAIVRVSRSFSNAPSNISFQ
jgi:hypothetical protein